MPFDNDFGSIGFSYNTSSGSFGPSMSLGSGLAMDLSTGSVGLKVGSMLVGTADDDDSTSRRASSNATRTTSADAYVAPAKVKTASAGSGKAGRARAETSLWAKIKSWFS